MRVQPCEDKASSGVLDKPCHMVKQYCTTEMFATVLATNCPRTCNKCPDGTDHPATTQLQCSNLTHAHVRTTYDKRTCCALLRIFNYSISRVVSRMHAVAQDPCLSVSKDRATSGVMNKTCQEVKQYCTDASLATMLATNCPETCNNCTRATIAD